MKQKFDVTGMSCAACSAAVERAVNKLEGVQTAQVNLLANSMQVEYDGAAVDEKCHLPGGGGRRLRRKSLWGQKLKTRRPRDRTRWRRS